MESTKPLRMKDLAAKIGVSTTTVSRALNGERGSSPELQKRILKLAQEHGYRRLRRKPLRRLDAGTTVRGRIAAIASNRIGDRLTDPNDIYAYLMMRMHAYAAEVGWDVVVDWLPASDSQALPEVVQRAGVDGALLISAMPCDILERMAEQIPVVCVNSYTAWIDVPCFLVDNRRMMTLAVEHLVQMGHRCIGYVNEQEPDPAHGQDPSYSINQERRDSYLQALRKFNLPSEQDLWEPFYAPREVFAQAIRSVLARLLDRPDKPTALIVPLRWMLFVLPELARRNLRVPTDMSILTIDDGSDATSTDPNLSAMSSNHHATVEAAMACLMDRIAGKHSPARAVWIEPKLMQRDSVAPPRH